VTTVPGLPEDVSLLPEDKSHQGLQSDVADKVSAARGVLASFCASVTL
jgi:hypothetical protein